MESISDKEHEMLAYKVNGETLRIHLRHAA